MVAVLVCGALLLGCSRILLLLVGGSHQQCEETKDLQNCKGHTEGHLRLIQHKLIRRKLRKPLKATLSPDAKPSPCNV
ncbi:hypothetical protein E2C01_069873 [Portunus trituberculatus]|uniref:Secreted protein n=1 Tax=Portunus trituberculatus TaxID=210409 RepID=A0A5B7I3Y7_PORTR|nr:hypothetical protein [Portunus trituberculatus]